MVSIKAANLEQYINWLKNGYTDAMHGRWVHVFIEDLEKAKEYEIKQRTIFECLSMVVGRSKALNYHHEMADEIIKDASYTADRLKGAV